MLKFAFHLLTMSTPLSNISPVDGRYHSKTMLLNSYFSEFGLIKYRLQIEIEYFITLSKTIPQLKKFPKKRFKDLRKIYTTFEEKDGERIKKIERKTNHDVKAVEYFIKEEFERLKLSEFKEFIHFGLTSQDINNTATSYSIKIVIQEIFLPKLDLLIKKLNQLSHDWKGIPMLARTHGQAASPTRMGKEIRVFIDRLAEQRKNLCQIRFTTKFGGATGNFNAHHVAFPKINWKKFADNFLSENFNLDRQQNTTQIEHYDNMAAIFDSISRINTILIDLSQDIWIYVSMDYFKQEIKKGEIGSSAMPHKINPIDFENAEGNLGMANTIFRFLSTKLPVSRLQRDLTDSTVLRNVGVPFGHSLIAFSSLEQGLSKLIINKAAIQKDLENNWLIISEGIQNILRREGYPNPYELLKSLTRKNVKINQSNIESFINNLDIKESLKEELRKINPFTYTGI